MSNSSHSSYVDLTELWQSSHAHLFPVLNDGAFVLDAKGGCQVCGKNHALPLFADLSFAGTVRKAAQIGYCPDHARYYLETVLLQGYREELGLADSAIPDALDGRLWFRQPKILNIEPTTRCNFSCWYCVGRSMKQEDIDIDGFSKMLENFEGLEALALVGEGEPLLHKEFFKMAQMAREKNIRVLTISNGSAFSQSVIRQLCESEIAYVSISIDSHIPETFASSRLEGNLDKVLQGIKRLRDFRDANGYQYPKIGLKGTLFRDTQNQIPAIVEAAKAHGVEIFESFQPLNPKQNYIKIYPEFAVGEISSLAEVGEAIARDSAYGRQALKPFQDFCQDEQMAFFPEVVNRPLGHSCNETWAYSLLSGDITPCCQIKSGFSGVWNIFERKLDDIVNAPDYENVRFNLWNGIFPNYCSGCWKTR